MVAVPFDGSHHYSTARSSFRKRLFLASCWIPDDDLTALPHPDWSGPGRVDSPLFVLVMPVVVSRQRRFFAVFGLPGRFKICSLQYEYKYKKCLLCAVFGSFGLPPGRFWSRLVSVLVGLPFSAFLLLVRTSTVLVRIKYRTCTSTLLVP